MLLVEICFVSHIVLFSYQLKLVGLRYRIHDFICRFFINSMGQCELIVLTWFSEDYMLLMFVRMGTGTYHTAD